MISRFLIVLLAVALPAVASAQSLNDAIASASAKGDFGKAIKAAKISPKGVLAAERLPNGNYAIEAEFRGEANPFILPMTAERTEKGWSIKWTPDPKYVVGMANITRSGQLPKAEYGLPWAKQARLPSLPLVVVKGRILTPFGECDTTDVVKMEQGELEVIRPLSAHVKRWISEVLADDPGPAGVDVFVDPNLTWHDFNNVLITVALQGLYQVNIVTSSSTGIKSMQVAAPVAALSSPQTAPPLVVGMYDLDEVVGFRIGMKGEIYKGEAPCAVDMSLCATSPKTFRTMVSQLIAEELFKDVDKVKHAMFAATSDVTVGQAITYLDQVFPALKLTPNATFIGYIQK